MEVHEHQAGETSLLRRFVWSLILNAGLGVGEFAMSLLTGSTALLADALNNLDDAAALVLSIYSERVARRGADRRYTFGHQRIDVLTGLAKSCFLLFGAVVIVYRAICFLIAPVEIPGVAVLITATIALAFNVISAQWLKQDACHSLNAKGTYLCMVYDAVGSVAVMISAVATLFFGFVYFDVIASTVIVFLMTKSGLGLLRESVSILMQTAPAGFDYDLFSSSALEIPGVEGVDDIHVWIHAPGEHHLTCRIALTTADTCDCDRIVKAMEELCRSSFNIQHCTIQPVYAISDLSGKCGAPAR